MRTQILGAVAQTWSVVFARENSEQTNDDGKQVRIPYDSVSDSPVSRIQNRLYRFICELSPDEFKRVRSIQSQQST